MGLTAGSRDQSRDFSTGVREFPTRLVEQWFVFYSAEMGRGGWVQTAGPKGRMGVDLQYILSLYRRGSFMAGYVYERISKKLQLDKLIAHRLVGSIEDLRSAPFEVKLAGRVEFLSSDAKFRERVNSLIDFLEEKMIEIAGREQSRGRKLDRLLKAVSRK